MPTRPPILSRREFLSLSGAGALAFLGGAVAGEVYHAQVTRHKLALKNLRAPLKIVQLSDLHYGPYIHEGSVQEWVAQAQAEAADLIVITGDVVDRFLTRPLELLSAALAGLAAPLGVWACLGNHDRVCFHDLRPLEEALAAAGVTLLVNRGTLLRRDLYLAGVDDYGTGYPNLETALQNLPEGDVASVLLCHQPDYLPAMPLSVGLTLIGHTHGGQVQFPFLGPLRTSSRYGDTFAEGWVHQPDKAYVSRGLGVSLLPVRFNCPAELAVFELSPE